MYQHGKRTKQPHNMAVFLATVGIVGVVILVAWWIIHKDIGNSTGPRSTVPIVTEVGEDNEPKLEISENYFSFELPADWRLQEHVVNEGTANVYRYVATKKGADDRKLEVHVDVMPQVYKLVKMQPLIPNGNKFLLGNLSDECVNFAGSAGRQGTAEFPAKWENVSFVCDPITANQTIGTGTVEGGIKATLGRHSFFFLYTDHNIHPNDKILTDALRSFVTK